MDAPTTADEILQQIEALRKQIEDIHCRGGEPLTSDHILGLSRKLDRLLNYWAKMQGCRRG